MFIVCKEYDNGHLFPLHLDFVNEKESQRKIAWQSRGGFTGFKAVRISEIINAAKENRLDLEILTNEARKEFLNRLLGSQP